MRVRWEKNREEPEQHGEIWAKYPRESATRIWAELRRPNSLIWTTRLPHATRSSGRVSSSAVAMALMYGKEKDADFQVKQPSAAIALLADCTLQKPKLKLGKGKKPATNAVDTSFKARCELHLVSFAKVQSDVISHCASTTEHCRREERCCPNNKEKAKS